MEQLCEKISARCMGNGLFGEQLRYGSRFCAAGIQGMIVSWVEDGMRMPPKEMAKVMETMMMGSQQQAEGKQPATVQQEKANRKIGGAEQPTGIVGTLYLFYPKMNNYNF